MAQNVADSLAIHCKNVPQEKVPITDTCNDVYPSTDVSVNIGDNVKAEPIINQDQIHPTICAPSDYDSQEED